MIPGERTFACRVCAQLSPKPAKGPARYCKSCKREVHRAAVRRWRERNLERARALGREYARKNMALYIERTRARTAANPEAARAWARERYRKNTEYREDVKARALVWQASHPHSVAEKQRRRKALLKGNRAVTISKAEWLEIRETFGGVCAYCNQPATLTVDHVEPVARGGAHAPDNIVPACQPCNSSKGSKPLLVWLLTSGRASAAGVL